MVKLLYVLAIFLNVFYISALCVFFLFLMKSVGIYREVDNIYKI